MTDAANPNFRSPEFISGLARAEEIVRGEIQRQQARQRSVYLKARAEAIQKLWRCARKIREEMEGERK